MNSGAQRSCKPRDQAKGLIKLPMILIHLNLKISIEEKDSGLVSVEFIVTGSFFHFQRSFFSHELYQSSWRAQPSQEALLGCIMQ